MIRHFCYIIIFLCLHFSAFAEVANKIEVVGNDRVSDSTIKVYGDIDLNKKNNFNQEDLNLIIKKLYDTDFFEDINVSLNNSTLKIKVVEYKIINNLILEGEKANKVKEFITENIYSRSNSSFIKSKVNSDTHIIQEIYSSLGYNFAEIEVNTVKIDNRRLDLIFQLIKEREQKYQKLISLAKRK